MLTLTRFNPDLSLWSDVALGRLEQPFTAFDELRAHMDRWMRTLDGRGAHGETPVSYREGWPRMVLQDAGPALVLRAEVPGLGSDELNVSIERQTLTISGERKVAPREGYEALRRERGTVSFSRGYALPCPVDGEKATAVLKNGILELTLPKQPEAQPRQIAVKAG
jgi:HSP20 family protein